jgi:hypothetical protein
MKMCRKWIIKEKKAKNIDFLELAKNLFIEEYFFKLYIL